MGYQTGMGGPFINHLLFMDDLFGKSGNQIDSLIKTVQICSSDVDMEYVISICSVYLYHVENL